jgi:radical SAM protein with 4Fe4S-binding SPASM domain
MDDINIDGHKMAQHPLEVARWLQAGDDWEKARGIYPIYVEISPFGGCNFRCSFCAKDFLKYKATKIAPEILKRTLTTMALKGVKSVLFAGEGEPLLYKELAAIFEHGAEAGIDMALNTNAAVDNEPALLAAARHARWIRASVNAGNAAEHARIHHCREDVFDKVFENLRKTVAERDRTASGCVIGAQTVLLEDNRESTVELARRARAAGVDYLVIKPYSQHPESFTHQHEAVDYSGLDELRARVMAEQSERFKVYFRAAAFARAREGAHGYHRCYSVPMFWAYIRSTGEVSGCSAFLTDENFYFGNLNEMGFDEIWEGLRRQEHFERMKTHDISRCRVNCRMDKVNEYLWQLKNPGAHVNFI